MKVYDQVTWRSQAGGRITTKTGQIVATVPAGTAGWFVANSLELTSLSMEPMRGDLHRTRNHESFIVSSGGKLYWPLVKKLSLC